MVLDELKDTTYELFTDFKANPTVTNVKDGVKAFKEAKADLVIAMGVDTTGMSIDKRLMPRSKRWENFLST